MRILVTGSTGFIGGALCRELCRQGHSVIAFHRPSSNLRLLEGLAVEHAVGDLTQPATIQAAMDGVEAVFHVGALLGSRQMARSYAVIVEGTQSILQAARVAGVRRVVYTSSVAALGIPEYGRHDGSGPMTETHAWNYRPDYWPYGYAKYLAEIEIQRAVSLGQDVVIVNPSVVYGPGDIYRQSSSVIVQVARQRLPFITEGGVNVVHVDDVVAGHLAALERGRRGERYILGGENIGIERLVALVAEEAGVAAPGLVLPPGLVRGLSGVLGLLQSFLHLPLGVNELRLAGYDFYYDSRKALLELGLPAPKSARQAVADALAWFIEVGALTKKQ